MVRDVTRIEIKGKYKTINQYGLMTYYDRSQCDVSQGRVCFCILVVFFLTSYVVFFAFHKHANKMSKPTTMKPIAKPTK